MADDKKKEYSVAEVQDMLQKLGDAVASGNFQNTVIGAPLDASTYDATAANANAMLQTYIGRYSNEMLRVNRLKRQSAVAASLGSGPLGASLLGQLSAMNPGLGNSIMGLHGIDEAQQIALMGANGMAASMGRPMGGVMSPGRMASNMRWAATQGAMALNNAFNKDGSVNAGFTYGLSLPQTAVVNNAILSDKSIRDEWASKELGRIRRWNDSHPGATNRQKDEAGIMEEWQVTRFRDGTGLTADAVRSFNDHIKDFQKEMNGFVASVSKITGSFESAVDFMQDMTNGKAFSAGRQAGLMRDRAMKMAANLRVAAADAGIDSRTMYNMMYNPNGGFANTFDTARGKDYIASRMGDRSVTGDLANLSANAFAKWKQANPNATPEQLREAQDMINKRVEGFGEGDADEHNVLLAEAVRNGDISKEEARKLAASGDQQGVYNRLKKIYGSNVDLLLKDSVFLESTSKRNSALVGDLNTLSMTKAWNREAGAKNQTEAMDKSRVLLEGKLGVAMGRDVSDEIEKIHKESLLDERTLTKAGLSKDQIAKARKMGESMDARSLQEYLVSDMGANAWKLNSMTSAVMGSTLKKTYGGNKDAARALRQFNEINGEASPLATEQDKAAYVARKKAKEVDARNNKLREAYLGAIDKGDTALADKIMGQMTSEIDASMDKEGDTRFDDRTFMEFMLEQSSVGMGFDKSKKLISEGLGAYDEASDAGASHGKTMEYVAGRLSSKGYGKNAGKLSKFLDPKKRKELLTNYRRRNAAMGLFGKVLETAGLGGTEEGQKLMTDFLRRIGNTNGLYRKYGDDDRLAAMKMLGDFWKAADGMNDNALKKAGLTDDAVKAFLKSDDAKEIINSSFLGDFDKLGANMGYLTKTADTSKLTDEEVSDIEEDKAEKNNLNFNAQYSSVKSINDALSEAAGSRSSDHTQALKFADAVQARTLNKSLGQMSDLKKGMIQGKLGVSKKMHAIREMFDKKDGEGSFADMATQWMSDLPEGSRPKDYKGGAVSNKYIADIFEKFLTKTAGTTDKEFEEALKNDNDLVGGLGYKLKNSLLYARDDNGEKISSRYLMSAFIGAARSGKTGADRDKAAAEGYMMEAIRQGDPLVPKDEKAVLFQKNVESYLAQIATNTSK